MRHLLFPGRCQPLPPPPTRAQAARARVLRHWRALQVLALETWGNVLKGGALVGEPGAWVAVWALCALPPSTGQQHAVINFWIQAAIMIVAAIVAVALAPKPPVPKPHALADFDVPTAEEGRPVAKIFGEMIVPDPNVLWHGDLSSTPIKKKAKKK